MSKEKASMLLSTALYKDDPEEIKSLILAAQAHLSSGPSENPISFMELTFDQIHGAILLMKANLPKEGDSPETLIEKFALCESQLLTILEYAKQGLKARTFGSGEAAEIMLRRRDHITLEKFEEA